MNNRQYSASLSRSEGRSAWSIIFRHPVRSDTKLGKGGLRVRQGLGTHERDEAEKLCEQMNQLLSDERYWNPSARSEAEKRFHSRVVEIFYYKMLPEQTDFSVIRDEFIPLPNHLDSNYRRVLFLGTTGAGKTTLLRQILGTDPKKERFPSTSTAKTTIHDTEVVLDEGLFRVAVTFFPLDEVSEHLSDCLSAAVLAAYRGESDGDIMRRMLSHVNQRFRFNYILGNGPKLNIEEFDEDEDYEDVSTDIELSTPVIDLEATNTIIATAIGRVKKIASRHGEAIKGELGATDEKDKRVVDELFEEELDSRLRHDDDFHEILDQLIDEIEKRFDLLDVGTLKRSTQGWPQSFFLETKDRDTFIKSVSRFSSNHAPWFGTLLTPVVNGVRVAGPFGPTWNKGQQPRLVIYDGEGLGHTPRSVATISTTVSRRIDLVDAVVLVDNAQQPMQAAPVAAMREIVSTGNASKLIFVFTHLDLVTGDNIPTVAARKQHVLASAENVLASIGEELGPYAERAIRQRMDTHRFFLSGIDQALKIDSKPGKQTISQLNSLLEAIDSIIERPKPVKAKPEYDRMNLVLAVKSAAENFRESWFALLGIEDKPGIAKEHWTRIKALSRRLATPGWADEYDGLKPVADLRQQLQNRLYVLVQNPVRWEPEAPEPTDNEKQQVFEALANLLNIKMLDLASRRVRAERFPEWQTAFNESGTHSSFRRARIIAIDIYDRAAPVPNIAPSPDRNNFLHEVACVVEEAVREVGGKLV